MKTFIRKYLFGMRKSQIIREYLSVTIIINISVLILFILLSLKIAKNIIQKKKRSLDLKLTKRYNLIIDNNINLYTHFSLEFLF